MNGVAKNGLRVNTNTHYTISASWTQKRKYKHAAHRQAHQPRPTNDNIGTAIARSTP